MKKNAIQVVDDSEDLLRLAAELLEEEHDRGAAQTVEDTSAPIPQRRPDSPLSDLTLFGTSGFLTPSARLSWRVASRP